MIGTHTSSVAPGYTVDSKIATPPRPMARPTVVLALLSGVRSGRLPRPTGVGTDTTKTLQPLRPALSQLTPSWVPDRHSSDDTPRVWSRCYFNSSMRAVLTSKPTVDNLRPKPTANGRPT